MIYPPVFLCGLTALGVLVGYASGLFGVGGGFMMTPLLIALFGIAPEMAVGSGLAQMIVVGIGASWQHGARGFTDIKAALAMSPGVLIGTYIGKSLLGYLTGLGTTTVLGHRESVAVVVLDGIFILLLIAIALRLWQEDAQDDSASTGPLCWPGGPAGIALPASRIDKVSLLSLSGAGLVIGVMAGLLGIGGGVILVPLLVYGYHIGLRMAIGTSSLLILISSIAGAVQYASAGQINFRVVIALAIGSLLGVQIGAWHSHRLSHRHLRRLFALLVLAVVVIILVKFVI